MRGAIAVVKATASANGHRPRLTSSIGPDSKVVSCTMPAVDTFISMASHSTANSTRAAKVSARWRFSGSARVSRSAVPQRTQLERMSGPSAGTIWNWPQPGHSRSCGLVMGGLIVLCADFIRLPRMTGEAHELCPAPWPSYRGGLERRCSRLQQRGDAVGELAHGVADRRHQAGNALCRHRLGDREGARRQAARPVELDGDLGEQDERAGPVGIETLEVDADGGVGVRGDGAALAVDRAARQAR